MLKYVYVDANSHHEDQPLTMILPAEVTTGKKRENVSDHKLFLYYPFLVRQVKQTIMAIIQMFQYLFSPRLVQLMDTNISGAFLKIHGKAMSNLQA